MNKKPHFILFTILFFIISEFIFAPIMVLTYPLLGATQYVFFSALKRIAAVELKKFDDKLSSIKFANTEYFENK